MSNSKDRMKFWEDLLSLIDRKREETGDNGIGTAIERAILEQQMRELEQDIFENPGAIEPWLVKLRRPQ